MSISTHIQYCNFTSIAPLAKVGKHNICHDSLGDYKHTFRKFIGNCTLSKSCKCNVCLRQPLSLRNLASHSVVHLTFNLPEFTLTGRTLFDQFFHTAESPLVPQYKLVPHTNLTLQCTFVRNKRCDCDKRFHDDCVSPSERLWSTFHVELCVCYEELVAIFLYERIHGGVLFVINPY